MNPLLVIIEFDMVVAAILWIVIFRRTKPTFTFLQPLEKQLGRLARRKKLAILSVGLFTLVFRTLLILVIGIPRPAIHDEFSHLLAADTFAHGRLTNPPHPMWIHFESFHIIQQPSYMSMYPPGQGLALALGQVLGHPWIGVLLSTSAMCAAICWALQGWLEPEWALFGSMMVVYRHGLFGYWMNSFWGGSVPALGGALVFGALPRITRQPNAANAVAMGLGLTILANSRPCEGLIFSVASGIVLAYWIGSQRSPAVSALSRNFVLPLMVVLITGALATGCFYYRVTGNPFRMTYQVNRETYATARYFVWQKPRPEPQYHHIVMQKFYEWENEACLQNRTFSGYLSRSFDKISIAFWVFYLGPVLTIPLFALRQIRQDANMRQPLYIALMFAVGLSMETWVFPHYIAPATALIFLLITQATRHLETWKDHCGRTLVRVIPLICCLMAVVSPVVICLHSRSSSIPRIFQDRINIERSLSSQTGPQLVVVRYGSKHELGNEWVYNRADIDGAKIVWARDMGSVENTKLREYFVTRKAWLLEADEAPPRLSPYQ